MENDNSIEELERQMSMLESIPVMTEIPNVQTVTPEPVQQTTVQQTTSVQPQNTNFVTSGFAQPITTQNQQSTAQVVQSTTVSTKPKMEDILMSNTVISNDLTKFDTDFDVDIIDITENVDESKIPFINLKPGESTRIMVFTNKMASIYSHYIKNLGYLRCLSKRDGNNIIEKAPCCMFIDENKGYENHGTRRFIFPVIEYPVSKDGKSLLAGKQPRLAFLNLTGQDRTSLMSVIGGDEEKTKAAMSMDLTVSIDASDTYKKKLFASTFNTFRNQYTNINEEISKYNTEMLKQAVKESYKTVPAQTIQLELNKVRQIQQTASQLDNQQFIMDI